MVLVDTAALRLEASTVRESIMAMRARRERDEVELIVGQKRQAYREQQRRLRREEVAAQAARRKSAQEWVASEMQRRGAVISHEQPRPDADSAIAVAEAGLHLVGWGRLALQHPAVWPPYSTEQQVTRSAPSLAAKRSPKVAEPPKPQSSDAAMSLVLATAPPPPLASAGAAAATEGGPETAVRPAVSIDRRPIFALNEAVDFLTAGGVLGGRTSAVCD